MTKGKDEEMDDQNDLWDQPPTNDFIEKTQPPPRQNFIQLIITTITRMRRAVWLDKFVYADLKNDDQASSQATVALIIISVLTLITNVLFYEYPADQWFYFLVSFFVSYFLSALVVWIIGVKLFKAEGSFNTVSNALAFGFTPRFLYALPFPAGILGFWSIPVEYAAIKRTLGIRAIFVVILLVVEELTRMYLTPIIAPLLTRYLFFWAISP